MMIRTLNVLALAALIGSATAAYSVKYETILIAEKLRKREAELARERDAISVLKAEWQLLNRPARLAALAQPEAGMRPLSVRQMVRAEDIPQARPGADMIASALDGLLTGSLPAPAKASKPAASPKPAAAGLSPRPAPKPAAAKTASATPRPDATARTTTPGTRPATGARPAAANNPMMLRPPAAVGSRAPAQTAGANPAPARDPISRLLGLGTKPVPAKPVDEN